MKRLIYVAGTLGMMWAAPAYSRTDSSDPSATADTAHDAVRHALADSATVPPDSGAGSKEKKHKGADKKMAGSDKDKKDASSDKRTARSEKDKKEKKGKGADKSAANRANSVAHGDMSKHADKASHEAMRMAHDRAMKRAVSDANASHVDAANRAAMHWAGRSRDQATSESHDAAGKMRTRIEHRDTRGMDGRGEGGGEGGGGEGGGWVMPGTNSGSTTSSSSTHTAMSESSTTRTGK